MECPSPERIAAAISGELPVEVRGDLLDHAATCASCHAVLMVLDGDTQLAIGSAPPTPGVGPARIGEAIGRYQLVALLGSGGMGVVYRARDTELDRDVALKLLRPGRPADRLRREAQLLAKLDAPNLVTVYDVGTHAGAAYVVMELVDGQSLRGYLAAPHPAGEILAVCVQAGDGLAAAHRAGVVHRDFKPDNVFVARDGSVHVGDFGLAGASPGEAKRVTTADLTVTGTVLGTPAYMAPEQIDGEATAASDQYAFCVTVWEALTGKRPIDAPTIDTLFAAIRAGTLDPPARPLPAHVERALRRGLARAPADRFPDMPALLAALAPRRRWPYLAAGAGALGIAGAIAAVAIPSDAPGCVLGPRMPSPALGAIARQFGPAVRAEAEASLSEWETARGDACRLADQPRLACLRVVALRGDATLAQLAEDPTLEPDLSELGVDRGVARCLALPPSLTPALAAFDVEAARVDILLQRTVIGDRALFGLERFAAAVGAPAVARAQWLVARSAAERSDNARAAAALPALIASADKLRDDELRARASALSAEVLGRMNRAGEARVALEQARAGWARTGRPDELALGRAEIAILVAENQLERAAQRAEALLPLVRARYAMQASRVTAALGRASALWSAAGNYQRAVELQAEQLARAKQEPPPPLSPDELASLMRNPTEATVAGDHRAAIAIVEDNLAIMRRALVAWPGAAREITPGIGYQLSQLAQGHELLAESAEALVWYRNLLAYADEPRLDAPVSARFRADALEGIARHLNRLGRHAEATAPARAAVDQIRAATDPEIRANLVAAMLQLARALYDSGAVKEARPILEEAYTQVDEKTAPFTRGIAAAYLAYALWGTGDARDRGRAGVLAEDAARHFEKARGILRSMPSLRYLEPMLDRDVAALARWRARR